MMDFGYPQTTESKILQEYVDCRFARDVWIFIVEIVADRAKDTSRKNHTSWKFKHDHQLQSQMLSHGEVRAFDTVKTKSFSMSSSLSIF
jgi:hypothetical protein